MLQLQWKQGKPEKIVDTLSQDELFVVLPSEDANRPQFWSSFADKASSTLGFRLHHLKVKVGFFADGCRPFALMEWGQRNVSPNIKGLEKRWIFRQAMQKLTTIFSVKSINLWLPSGSGQTTKAMAEDVFFMLNAQKCEYEKINIFSDPRSEVDDIRFAYARGYAEWINENPDELTSLEISRRLEGFAHRHDLKVEVLDRAALEKEQMNLLLAVGQASQKSPSRLVVLQNKAALNEKPLVLIGKGITFDTGGINVKPFDAHVNCMKNDMGGAALMAHLFMALIESGYQRPLALVVPCCENLVAAESMKPGAIVKSHSGKNVLIEHTDAEGRLILADAISYTQKYLNPERLMVAATLTTAALRQFSGYFTPIYFASDGFKSRLIKSAEQWGEGFVFWDEFLPFAMANKTIAADLTNMGRLPKAASIGGGSAVAAHFLKSFAQVPMIHCDIFASCWNWSGDYPGAEFGATAAAFNSLFETLRTEAR